jgi:acyl carrier protein
LLGACRVLYVDHVATTTADLDGTLVDLLSIPGAQLVRGPGWNEPQRVHYAFVGMPRGEIIEVLAPGAESPIQSHVNRGGGAYHVCYAVADIDEAVKEAQRRQAKLLNGPVADDAFGGGRVAFLFHPLLGLFEFVQSDETHVGPPARGAGAASAHPAGAGRGGAVQGQTLLGLLRDFFPEVADAEILSARMGETPGWDSLQQVRLAMEVESRFGIEIPAEDISRLTSYEALRARLEDSR